jgi:small membrane protein
MRPIQYLLLGILASGLAVYLLRLRSRVADRLLVCALACGAAAGILVPDVATWTANLLGVGRGVDFVFYLALFTLSYLWVLQATKQRQTQQRITRLVRAMAIETARAPSLEAGLKRAA